MPAIRSCLRLLLLFAALLNYAAAASAHDHDAPTVPGDSLCAICVYAGGALGGAPTPQAAPLAPQWHAPPQSLLRLVFTPRFISSCSIRGPPTPS